MKKVEISLYLTEVEDVSQLPAEEQELIRLARHMTTQAYAPYSGFYVGAAILLENGEIIKGSNQENAAYPSGLCAERVAAFAASASYPDIKMKAIAISGNAKSHNIDHPVTPCGACRQVLLEYEVKQDSPMKIFLSGHSGKIFLIEKAQDLLPLSFTSKDLENL
ncbi:MAG: cytidine deaminase [Bacteroidetes bacterium]|nr:MAG: cytidine deaminase [Bacteroidota bacterium]